MNAQHRHPTYEDPPTGLTLQQHQIYARINAQIGVDYEPRHSVPDAREQLLNQRHGPTWVILDPMSSELADLAGEIPDF